MNVSNGSFDLLDDTTLRVFSGMFEEAVEEWKALLEWCRFHGLDPELMPAAQTIVRDPERCRVMHDAFVLDVDGTPKVNPGSGHMFLVNRAHAQGETPPLPFPDVILAHLDRPAPPTREPGGDSGEEVAG